MCARTNTPTPSEPAHQGDWAARTSTPRRSVFGNYRQADADAPSQAGPVPAERTSSGSAVPQGGLQAQIDLAMARAFCHRFLAAAFADPTRETWDWLCDPATQSSLRMAWDLAAGGSVAAGILPAPTFVGDSFVSFQEAYVAAFGHAARGSCPLNEIEYGDLKADPLFQPHRLADLAAFYRAFGLEVADDAGERHDHLCLELEFMCVLAAKEAYALEHQHDPEELVLIRDAQKKFLREHLGRWTPAFTRRLAGSTTHSTLRALAGLARDFIESECARFAVGPGSEDLLLRPVDESADCMCDTCGLSQVPPGASAAT